MNVRKLLREASDFVRAVRAEHALWSTPLPFRLATVTDRATAIVAARARLASLRNASFSGYQLGAAADLEAFHMAMIERLERGDAFMVPDVMP